MGWFQTNLHGLMRLAYFFQKLCQLIIISLIQFYLERKRKIEFQEKTRIPDLCRIMQLWIIWLLILYLMKSTASTTQISQGHWLGNTIHRRIQELEDKVKYLDKVIVVKDHALQQLDKLFKEQLALSKGNITIHQKMGAALSSFMDSSANQSKTSNKLAEQLRKHLNDLSFDYVNYYQMEQTKLMKEHNDFVKILRNVGWAEYKGDKDFSLNLQKSQRNSIKQAYIYQIPIQLHTQKSTQHALIQVDLFQTPVNTEQIENANDLMASQLARPISSEIVEIPIEIKHTHEIEVHMIQVHEIPTQVVEIREIPIQLITLHQIPVVIRRDVQIPIQLELVEEPQEENYSSPKLPERQSLDLRNSIDSLGDYIDLRNQIDKLTQDNQQLRQQNEELSKKLSEISSNRNIIIQMGDLVYQYQLQDHDEQQGELSIPVQIVVENQTEHDFSLFVVEGQSEVPKEKLLIDQLGTNDDLESHIKQNNSKRGYRNNIVSLSNLSPKLRSQLPQSSLPHIQIEPSQFRNEILLIQQDGAHSLKAKVDSYIQQQHSQQQSQVFKIKQTQSQAIPNPSALAFQIKEVLSPEIREIPVEPKAQKEVIRQVIVEKQVIKQVYKQIIKQTIIQKQIIKEVPIIKQIPVQVFVQVITQVPIIHQVPVEVIVEREKLVQVTVIERVLVETIKQVPVEVIRYIEVPIVKEIIKEVKAIEYLRVIKQIPVEVIVQVQKIVEKIVQRPVYVKIPILKEVPVQVITEVQKKVYVKIPVIKQVPVQVIKEVPAKPVVHKLEEIVAINEQYQNAPLVPQAPRNTLADGSNTQTVTPTNMQIVRQIYEIPVEVVQQRVVDRFIQIQRITHFTTTDYIQIKQFIEVPVEKKQYVPIVVEVPVQLNNHDSEIQIQNIKQDKEEVMYVPDRDYEHEEIEEIKGLEREIDEFYRNQNIVEVPVECLVSKYVEVQKQVAQVYQIPVIVQVEKIVEVQKIVYIQKIVEKIVEVQKIVQKEKIVEKLVQIQKIVQVPIYEQVQKIVYVYKDRIVEVPVEVIIEEVTEVPSILEVPVQLQIHQLQWPSIVEVPVDMDVRYLEQIPMVIEIPVEMSMEIQISNCQMIEREVIKQVEKIVEVEKIVQVEKIVEIEIEVERIVQKFVEVQKIVQIQKMGQVVLVQLEKIVEVEKIVYVDRPVEKIVQVQKIIQKIVVVEKPVPYVVEVPVQLQNDTVIVIEIPVEMNTIPQVYEVPVQVIPPVTLYEVPVNIQNPPHIAEVPVQLIPKDKSIIKTNKPHENIEVRQVPLTQDQVEIQIMHSPNMQMSGIKQIQIQFPYQIQAARQCTDHQVQTEQDRFMMQMDMMSNIDKAEHFNRLESNSEGGMHSMLKVWEIPVELELDYNIEEIQRSIEQKYKEKYSQLHSKYNGEIGELHLTIDNMQKIVFELNQQRLELNEIIQNNALIEENLKQKLYELEMKDEKNQQYIVNLTAETEKKAELIQRTKDENQQLHIRLERILTHPLLQELPVQINISTQKQHCQVQTQELQLFDTVSVIQIPVQIGHAQHLSSQTVLKGTNQRETEQTAAQTDLLHHFHSNKQQYNVQVGSAHQFQQQDSHIHQAKIDIMKIYDQLQGSYKFKIDDSASYYNGGMVSGIQVVAEYQNIVDSLQVYELAVQLVCDPIIYEVPIQIKQSKETTDIESQTDDTLIHLHTEVVEMPVELIFNQDESEYSYHSLNASHEKHTSGYRKIQERSEKVQLTDSDSQIVNKQESLSNKRKQTVIKEKPYSEYYSSRMIEIPIELEINRYNKTNQELTLNRAFDISIAAKPEERVVVHEEEREMKIPSYLEASNIHNMQYDTSFQGYNPNYTVINDSFEKIRTPEEIARLVQKSEHHQAVHYPILSKPSQNVSLASEQVKDKIRHYQLTHPDMSAKKKYEGFIIQESSLQNITLTREMVIEEESEFNNSMELKRSPNLEITDLNYSDYANVRDKVMEIEQQRNNYQNLYEQKLHQLQSVKYLLTQKEEEISSVKNILDKEIARYQQELNKAELQTFSLSKEKKEHQQLIEYQKTTITELIATKDKLQDKIDKLIEGYEKLKDDSDKIERGLAQENEKLKHKLQNIKYDSRELKLDYQHSEREYQAQIAELNDFIQKKVDYIKDLEDELQKKEDKLEQMTENHEELRRNIASLRRNQDNDPAELYQQQFRIVKQYFQQQKQELSGQITHLNHELDMLRADNNDQKQEIAHLQAQIQQFQQHVEHARQQNSQLHHIKSQIEHNYITGIKQLEQIKDKLKQKQQLIQKYQNPTTNHILAFESKASKRLNESGQFRIEYLSRHNSEIESNSDNNTYMVNLQNLILKYEKMLIDDQKQIEEYQSKVCQYLRDALQKEQEAEGLFARLVEYEGMVNNILVEKVTLEVENKRLARAVEMSERKVQALGTKMLEAMGMRLLEQQQSERYYHYR